MISTRSSACSCPCRWRALRTCHERRNRAPRWRKSRSRCSPTSATRPARLPSATRTASSSASSSWTSPTSDIDGYVRRAPRSGSASASSFRPAITSNGPASSSISRRAEARLKIVVPFTLLIIFVLIYMNTQLGDEDVHRVARRAVLARRRVLVALPARLQHERRRVGRPHRARRPRRRDGRRDAALPRPRLGEVSRRRPHELR